jgi:hypothetical protein
VRLEDLPLVLGVVVGLLGLWLLWDAFAADDARPFRRERRRRSRADRDRLGEGLLAAGLLCMAAALAGRDSWRYANLAVIAGTVLIVTGAALNLRYLRELVAFRGPARRQPDRAPRGAEADRYVAGESPGDVAAPIAPPIAPPATPPVAPPPAADDARLRTR